MERNKNEMIAEETAAHGLVEPVIISTDEGLVRLFLKALEEFKPEESECYQSHFNIEQNKGTTSFTARFYDDKRSYSFTLETDYRKQE